MDYEALLKKYMEHVACCEGVTYVEQLNVYWDMPQFSDDEAAALSAMDHEVMQSI